MSELTIAERGGFSAAQLVQLDRLSTTRRTAYLKPDPRDGISSAHFRAMILAKWATKTPEQLRARVNFVSISWGSNETIITWAPESDYSTTEQASIQDILKARGGRFEDTAVAVAAGERSIEQRLVSLERA